MEYFDDLLNSELNFRYELGAEISNEIFREKLCAGDVWDFKEYQRFYNSLMDFEQKSWKTTMDALCADGSFTTIKAGAVSNYRLTEDGEAQLVMPRSAVYLKLALYNCGVQAGEWTKEQQTYCYDFMSEFEMNKYWDKTITFLCDSGILNKNEKNGIVEYTFSSEKALEDNRQTYEHLKDQLRKNARERIVCSFSDTDEMFLRKLQSYCKLSTLFPKDIVIGTISEAITGHLNSILNSVEDNQSLSLSVSFETSNAESFAASLKLIEDEEEIISALGEYYDIMSSVFRYFTDHDTTLYESDKADILFDFLRSFTDGVVDAFGENSAEKEYAVKCVYKYFDDMARDSLSDDVDIDDENYTGSHFPHLKDEYIKWGKLASWLPPFPSKYDEAVKKGNEKNQQWSEKFDAKIKAEENAKKRKNRLAYVIVGIGVILPFILIWLFFRI